ncbi:MAG: 50S ribosomal protein L25 [Candidatus Omnitrophica bacterium]|nr:50S ribosomal protein L25 [Candidatus Omnitrophota bacterium]
MEKIILKAQMRDGLGKAACKHLRREGLIPAVVYKEGKKALSVKVDGNDLWHALHTDAGENAIITMDISGDKAKKKTVIVKETQQDPINDNFLHVDFHEISLKEVLKVNVPVHLKGEAPGVTEEEGILSQVLWEMEVECLPTDIPENIEVHVGELNIGDAIYLKDITPPQGVKILGEPEDVVVTVNPPMAEEELEEEEALAEEGAEEPEVIKKGKKEEEEAEEAEGAEPEEKPSEGEE